MERASLLRTRLHAERKARREDWVLGPLAPNRAAGDEEWGCVNARETEGIKAWKGKKLRSMGYENRNVYKVGLGKDEVVGEGGNVVYVGDRVVVVGGRGSLERERGKVGRVTEVRKNHGEVIVEDLNMVSS